ncbi:MAG: tripartite tricarboxylate transporter substrate-binding protein [Deltaproteobacteria bacterium]|nr:tripartite tricarboxylate transporter substrate-binding protein [Deltaproteobacteria bacterium]
MKRVFAVLLSVSVIMLAGGLAFGQAFPTKPIHLVTAEAGGTSDLLARAFAQDLAAAIGQQVIVENRGGGMLPGAYVAKAPADGYTLLLFANSFWLAPLMRDNVPYDPVKGFVPVMTVATAPNVLVVNPSVPVSNVKEFIALAKSRPKKLTYSSAATGTVGHLAAELFKSTTGVDLVRTQQSGMAAAVLAVASGQVDCMFANAVMQHVKAGKMKALGVSTQKPSPIAPDVPTIASTVPGYKSLASFILFAPAGTPAAVVKKLNQELKKVMGKPEIDKKLAALGVDVEANTPEEARDEIQAELVSMGKVIKSAKIRAD